MSRTRRLLLGLVSVLLASVTALAWPAVATAAAPADPAYVRLAHLSPDTPSVDVYLGSVADPARRFVTPGVGYGTVSDYRSLPPDTYTVAMRPAGAAEGAPPVIATTLTTTPGGAYTVAGTGLYAGLGLRVLDDELTMPEAGTARIRVVNAAATAPQVDLGIDGGPEIAAGVPFAGSTDYRSVPIGAWTIDAAVPGGAASTSLPVDVASNAVYTVLLLDDGDRLAAELHIDSAGSGAVPLGGVETGFGPGGGPEPALLVAGTALLAVSAAAVGSAVARRRA